MPSVRLVTEEEVGPTIVTSASASSMTVWNYIGTSALLLAMIGTWLVWFSAFLQRSFQEDGIRAACQRAMPDQAERCFDAVMIQRGEARR
ncbi:MAG: intracellular growth attenuator family protein [Nitrospira sp.]|nr:intracellular growth attenuator family protein [Nitrospira sp.]MDH4370397.1 intracellular growth attenuator family protein [Nitrospira sp.]MDH5497959.1 intracellular growth attenuator family protein [Nitrospira sp.]